MNFITRLLARLREPSTWGAVSVLAIGVGASQDDVAIEAQTVAVGAALLGVFLPDAPKSDLTAVSRDRFTRSRLPRTCGPCCPCCPGVVSKAALEEDCRGSTM